MRLKSLYIVSMCGILFGCGSDKLAPEAPPTPPLQTDVVSDIDPVEQYPGLILKADMYQQYKMRFGMLSDKSSAKTNKIVRAMFSDSEAEKQNATKEFIIYWKDYAKRWTKEALDTPQPDGVSLRGVWRTIHLYDIVKSFGYLKPGEESDFRIALVQAVKWSIGSDSKNPRIPQDNWRMSNIYTDVFCAAGLVGLTFYDQPQSVDWVNHAISELKWQLDNCVWDDCWHETPRYHAYTMKLMGQFMEVLKNRTGIDLFQHDANRRMARWFVDFNTPLDRVAGVNAGVSSGVRMFAGLGDAAWGENLSPLNQFASHYRTTDAALSSELMWLWSQTGHTYSEEPVLDLLIDTSLPKAKVAKRGSVISKRRGYIVMRDGFETDNEVWFMLKCGATSMHDHEDKNSFSLIAYGTPLALDAGTGDYNDPSHRGWNKRVISHNVVAFRDKNQEDIFSYDSQRAVDGKILHWDSQPLFDYSVSDAATAARVSEYTREVLFVKPDYFVIRDKVSAATNKQSVWMMQTPCQNIEWGKRSIMCGNDWGTALEVHLAYPQVDLTPKQSQGRFGTWTDAKPDANTGLYPFKYQTTLEIVAPPIGQIVTVLHPMREGAKRLEVTSSQGGNRLQIKYGERLDEINFVMDGMQATIGDKNIASKIIKN